MSKPKFKRKTLKQWAAFVRRGRTKKPPYESRVHLHRFEDEVILRKWRETGETAISAKRLAGLYPDVFDVRGLDRALKRMRRQGTIKWCVGNRSIFGGINYELKEGDGADRAAA